MLEMKDAIKKKKEREGEREKRKEKREKIEDFKKH